MQRKRLHLFMAALLVVGLSGSVVGCKALSGQLTEEAKPQNAEERFLVTVAEFNRVATEAEVWLDGVIQQASIGDPAAKSYIPIAGRVADAISTGNRAIQGAQLALDSGSFEQFLRDGEALNNALTSLQLSLMAAGAIPAVE